MTDTDRTTGSRPAFGPGPVRAWLEHRRAELPGGIRPGGDRHRGQLAPADR